MNNQPSRHGGVVFVTTALEHTTEAALDTALAAARELEVPLECVFVENEELFHAAALPFTREVGRDSARRLEFEPRDLARALAAAARTLEDALRTRAGAARVVYRFRRTRGLLVKAAAGEADKATLAIVAAPATSGLAPRRLAPAEIRAILARRSSGPALQPTAERARWVPLSAPSGYALFSRASLAAEAPAIAWRLRMSGGALIVIE